MQTGQEASLPYLHSKFEKQFLDENLRPLSGPEGPAGRSSGCLETGIPGTSPQGASMQGGSPAR